MTIQKHSIHVIQVGEENNVISCLHFIKTCFKVLIKSATRYVHYFLLIF